MVPLATVLLACVRGPTPASGLPAEPAPPRVELSAFVFIEDRDVLEWQRIDPVAGTTRVIASFPNQGYATPELAWSPDGGRALVEHTWQMNAPWRPVFEVDVASGTLRELREVPDRSVLRLDDRGLVSFTTLSADAETPAPGESACRAVAQRERDGVWTAFESVAIPCEGREEEGWASLSSAATVGPTASELVGPAAGWLAPPPEAMTALSAVRPGTAAAPGGPGEDAWRVLAEAPGFAFFVYGGDTPAIRTLARRVDGAVAAPLDRIRDDLPGGLEVQVRSGWVLLRNYGTLARLYDGTGRLAWSSDDSVATTFWPTPR